MKSTMILPCAGQETVEELAGVVARDFHRAAVGKKGCLHSGPREAAPFLPEPAAEGKQRVPHRQVVILPVSRFEYPPIRRRWPVIMPVYGCSRQISSRFLNHYHAELKTTRNPLRRVSFTLGAPEI
jgi:hypothetical protein